MLSIFSCLLAMSSLEKCMFRASAIFWLGFFFCQLLHLQLFSSILKAVSSSCLWFLCSTKAFKFNKVAVVYFCFYFYYCRRWVIEDLAVTYVKVFSAVFSSKSFIVSGLTLRYLVHFEFIFVSSIRNCSNFITLHIAVQFSQHHYWRDYLFSIVYSCLLCQR